LHFDCINNSICGGCRACKGCRHCRSAQQRASSPRCIGI
jgi:hypothetical protein